MKRNPNGVILYEGPSVINGEPIVTIMTGLKNPSANRKTEGMVQTYILAAHSDPVEVKRDGMDAVICGYCPHRSKAAGGNNSCYVNVGHGALSVWRCWRRGGYPAVDLKTARRLLMASGRGLRIGTYGDPGAAPPEIWTQLYHAAPWHTGYTHRWREVPELRGVCMASVDNVVQAEKATAEGWATFRVSRRGDPLRLIGEARCPASVESKNVRTCVTCPIQCMGQSDGRVTGRVIQAHGATAGCCTGEG